MIGFERTRKILRFINVLMDGENDKMTSFLITHSPVQAVQNNDVEFCQLNGRIFTTREENQGNNDDYYEERSQPKSRKLMEVIRSENLKSTMDSLPLGYKLLFLETIKHAKEDLGEEHSELSV